MWNMIRNQKRTAIIDENERSITYQELSLDCLDFYKQMEDRIFIFILCKNCYAAIMAYLSCIEYECIVLLLSTDIQEQQLEFLVKEYMPQYIWKPFSKKSSLKGKIKYKKFGYDLLELNGFHGKIHKDLALLLSSSGSTGSPKLIKLSYKNIKSNVAAICEYLQISTKERTITTLPMQYTYGLSIINTYIFSGATLILYDKSILHEKFWEKFNKYQITSLSGVPYTFELLKKIGFFYKSHSHLRYITQAGGKIGECLQVEISNYAMKNRIKFYIMYGQTEATARMSYLPCELSGEKIGSIGIAIPGGRFKLIDELGNEIKEDNQIGELVYEGSNVMMGYAEHIADLNKEDSLHGQLLTGDLALCDKEGYYYLYGRKKRIVKFFGTRISLDDIENHLMKNLVGNCVCVGNDDKIIILYTNKEEEGKIKISLNAILKQFIKYLELVHIKDIPRTESGKINYKKIECLYQDKKGR